jgi:hypothetical protein
MKKKLPQEGFGPARRPGEGFGPSRRPGEAVESDVEGHSLGDDLRRPIDGLVGRPRTGGELTDGEEKLR